MSKKNTQQETVTTPSKVYNFCSKKKLILGVVVAVLVVFIAGAIIRGIHLAIEFKGGTLITYTYQGDINTNDVGSTVKDIVGSSVNVRTGENLDSGGKQLTISFTSDQGLTADRQTELTNALKEKFAVNSLEIYDSNDVSPSSGREFLLKCFIAVLFAAFIVIIYIAIRFKNIGGWSAGVCSIFALCLDVLVAFTTTIVCGFSVDSNIVAVILTILGYSINNTIVIYDRIRENRHLMPKASLNELINVSCTQSLTRSIRTSVTTIGTMAIITIVVLVTGYDSLLSFSVPLMMGLISGTFSSLFVAPVTWSWWKSKQDKKAKSSK
ncbi:MULTISPECIES: protein translocase subunit SecF [Ruminococcus]|uniref:Protein-export membrane protein SecF n=1 Tax=Ruminococcus flavefaciens TaxID=1265 RepID=A0A1M7GI40_RUMFL|nr:MULTISPECIES: protein translocase subunit SecF [Ruminococcus]MCR4795932.1 protein translocase subunit SecF [Ruminococcus sp.]SHM15943.1 preprotein translocase subunit SecF [Ruminococcus flavefaciens]